MGLSVEVASPEDLEHYSHVRRTGTAPEFRVTRMPSAEPEPAEPPRSRTSQPRAKPPKFQLIGA